MSRKNNDKEIPKYGRHRQHFCAKIKKSWAKFCNKLHIRPTAPDFEAERRHLLKLPAWYKDKYFYIALGVGMLMSLVALLPSFIIGHGSLHFSGDYDYQMLPFTMAASNDLLDGKTGWVSDFDLGSSFLGAYGYYMLASPFFYITALVPDRLVPTVFYFVLALKYGLATAFSYLYIRRFTKKRKHALLGGFIYGFCGWQAENLMFYMFHDVAVFLPLFLISFEELLVEKKRGRFALMTALMAMLNYFFFISEAVLIVIYFFCRFQTKDIKKTAKLFFRALFEALLGIGLAFFFLWPSFLYISSNPRLGDGGTKFFYMFDVFTEILRGIFLFPEIMIQHTSIVGNDFTSVDLWLPGVAFVLAFAEFARHPSFMRRFMICCIVIMLFPYLNNSFSLWTAYYYRWLIFPILILALASSVYLDHFDRIGTLLAGAANVLIQIGVFLMILFGAAENLFNGPYHWSFYLIELIAVLMVVTTIVLCLIKRGQAADRLTIWTVFSGLFVTGTLAFQYSYVFTNALTFNPQESTQSNIELAEELKNQPQDLDHRYRFNDAYISLLGDADGLVLFRSTASPATYRHYRYFERERRVGANMYFNEIPGWTELLGGKYNVIRTKSSAQFDGSIVKLDSAVDPDSVIKRFTAASGTEFVVTSSDACKMARKRDSFITLDEFEKLSVSYRGIAAIENLVIDGDAEEISKTGLKHGDLEKYIGKSPSSFLTAAVSRCEEDGVNIISSDTNGYKVDISRASSDEINYISLMVPHDDGFTAYADGKPVEIIDNLAMMAVAAPKGTKTLEFRYRTPGFEFGKTVSACSLGLYAVYMLVDIKHRIKERSQV